MAFVEKYANFDLATGLNDGSSEANAWQTPMMVPRQAIMHLSGQRAAYCLHREHYRQHESFTQQTELRWLRLILVFRILVN
jgi:hypothetical protein